LRFVLDSNIVIAALNGVADVKDRLAAVPAGEVGIPIVVIAELVYGACRSRRREENLAKLRQLRDSIPVLPITEGTADRYGALRADLATRGISKSDFDILVACTALDAGATLVTHDHALQDRSIADLVVEDWLAP